MISKIEIINKTTHKNYPCSRQAPNLPAINTTVPINKTAVLTEAKRAVGLTINSIAKNQNLVNWISINKSEKSPVIPTIFHLRFMPEGV